MNKTKSLAVVLVSALMPLTVVAAPGAVLIRNATVHTASAAGVLQHTDVLISDGRIAELGHDLKAPAGAEVIEANGKPVTPGLFGGVSHLGIEEIGLESTQNDYSLKLGSMRPEFDVSLAFNPESVILGVARLGGITFAMVSPSAEAGGKGAPGGTLVAGQGAVAQLNGSIDAGTHALFVDFGGDASALSGGSRAAQFMLFEQAIGEARSPKALAPNDQRLLSPAGRQTLLGYLNGNGPVVFDVDRASDIRQVIALAKREKLRAVIKGGQEAWRVAPELAAAHIPVVLNPLDDLPANLDVIGATLENAARLNRVGVKIAFTLDDPQAHNIRKVRQTAGIAVVHGLPPEAGLAAMTSNPAEIFGVASRNGSIARGRPADLVLWSGDPLEVTTLAERVFIDGEAQPMQSRQTLLRDRYLEKLRAHAAR
ncbi:MAG: amidohydrolase family protein [Steroidobacteraceae bacterium]